MNFLIFIVAILATYRLALLVSEEDGPMWIFRKLRNLPPRKSSAHEGIRCIWCVGVYASALVTTFLWWRGYVAGVEWPLHWIAIAGGAVGLNQMWTRN